MATWGTGNFDCDDALDYLTFVVDRWITNIDRAFAGEAPEEAAKLDLAPGLEMVEGCIMPTIELIMSTIISNELVEHFPDPEKVANWYALALTAYDTGIEEFDEDEDYKKERRQVIVNTFDRFLLLCTELAKDLEGPTSEGDNLGP